MKLFGANQTPSAGDLYRLGRRAVRALEEVVEPVVTPKSNGDDGTKLTVESFDNHVYFYADVDSDRCLAMIKSIQEVDARLRNERETRRLPDSFPPTPIWLHIQSDGGGLFAGLAAADQLGQIKTPVYSIAEGVCASAATLISMACHRRYITPSSFMLIHQFTAGHWGTHEEFKDEMKLQEMLIELLANFYTGKSKISKEQVKEYLKRDSWFNAKQCLELGLVDEIR